MSRYWPWVAQESAQREKHLTWWPTAAFSRGTLDLSTPLKMIAARYSCSRSATSSPGSGIHDERRRAELTE
jgi:hypothetical protein